MCKLKFTKCKNCKTLSDGELGGGIHRKLKDSYIVNGTALYMSGKIPSVRIEIIFNVLRKLLGTKVNWKTEWAEMNSW